MQVRSYAKINWALRITGKRADGFHDLETLFQQISLHDELTFRRAERLQLSCDDPSIPADDSNLVLRAAHALGVSGVAIELRKRIPSGGGLGGGSSNAAATLVALNEMFSLGRTADELAELALALGSDVPFFLVGGTAYGTGRGERLTPIAGVERIPLLLLLPPERVSTREAFARIARYSQPVGIDAFRGGVLSRPELLVNDFEEPVFTMVPRLRDLKARLIDAGAAWAGMSGSGSTIFGAFESPARRDEAMRTFTGVRAVAAETM